MPEIITINVLDIYLDPENPRHDPIQDQDKIIEQLLKSDKVRELARDIAANGLNPLELLGVIKDKDNNYIAVEGNRRLCSLKLLNDPESAPAGASKYFKQLSEASTLVPTDITCIQLENRDAADIWIERRHEGEQGGVGIRQWNSTQKTRHNTRRMKKDSNALALSIIEYAFKLGLITRPDGEKKILTTASRYLGNPYFRKTIGVVSGRSDSSVVINVTYDDFDRVIERFLKDILDDTTDVNSRTNKASWEGYARRLINEGDAPVSRAEKIKLSDRKSFDKSSVPSIADNQSPTRNGDISSSIEQADQEADISTSGENQNYADNGKPRQWGSQTQDPDKRKYILPYDFNPTISDKILRRVFREMKNIETEHYALAVSLITRAFLEKVYKSFYESKIDRNVPSKTNDVLTKIIPYIEGVLHQLNGREKQALGALRRVNSNPNNVLSPKTLGAFAHAGHYPTKMELHTQWDNISEIVAYMIREL
ncbi:hypothetical protein QWI17_09140 [Gilvimarinus sp. SDUM040013]|uniref:ParB/Sulfiredoxin domain-containing protein n=1 Tax=Gilvimarinus gilvus TaxID=3058038 RepID=A0ABU4RZX2_9GAMM|nr:hypothetical protein [Gilvimarinus sp. SDUM040013]MDO3385999.1 hypothetical protein [Gilvimarinus sp. SDUM040013]MDX6850454.1 hypothetical protein [Gilvimarinus sp. SDUM040013]